MRLKNALSSVLCRRKRLQAVCVTISTLCEAGIIKLTARSIKTWSEYLHVDLTVPGSDGADGETGSWQKA